MPFTEKNAVRVKTPNATIEWNDLRLGKFFENPAEQCGDFAIKDRAGQWTYQFAVVADDLEEGIGLVVRGEDLRASTARQIALSQALGRKTPPLFLHHPLICAESGKKLSKREHAASIRGERELGISPEKLLGEVCVQAGLLSSFRLLSVNESILLAKKHLFSKI